MLPKNKNNSSLIIFSGSIDQRVHAVLNGCDNRTFFDVTEGTDTPSRSMTIRPARSLCKAQESTCLNTVLETKSKICSFAHNLAFSLENELHGSQFAVFPDEKQRSEKIYIVGRLTNS